MQHGTLYLAGANGLAGCTDACGCQQVAFQAHYGCGLTIAEVLGVERRHGRLIQQGMATLRQTFAPPDSQAGVYRLPCCCIRLNNLLSVFLGVIARVNDHASRTPHLPIGKPKMAELIGKLNPVLDQGPVAPVDYKTTRPSSKPRTFRANAGRRTSRMIATCTATIPRWRY